MSYQPLVSVVIPVYNVEQYLRQCLDSVVNQTYQNLEIICVNDGSPDHSINILNEFASKEGRVKVFTIENLGLSGARNVGVAHCTGEYLMFLDSDDWVDNDVIECAVSAMRNYDVDMVLWNYVKENIDTSSPVIVFDQERTYFGENFSRLHQRLIGLIGEQLAHPEKLDSISTAWGKLYKTDTIKHNNIEFVDTRLIGTEDLLFNAEVFNYCTSAVALPKTFNHYRRFNMESLTKQYKPKLYEQWSELQRRLEMITSGVDRLIFPYKNRIVLSIIGLGINEVHSDMSFYKKVKRLRSILSSPSYVNAIKDFDVAPMPPHWKLFFWAAKYRHTIVLIILLYGIELIRNYHR